MSDYSVYIGHRGQGRNQKPITRDAQKSIALCVDLRYVVLAYFERSPRGRERVFGKRRATGATLEKEREKGEEAVYHLWPTLLPFPLSVHSRISAMSVDPNLLTPFKVSFCFPFSSRRGYWLSPPPCPLSRRIDSSLTNTFAEHYKRAVKIHSNIV